MYLRSYFIQLAKNIFIRFPRRIFLFFKFFSEYFIFKKRNDGRLEMKFSEIYPCLNDRINTTPFDRHYTYHPAWAARILAKTRPEYHVDFSSILSFGTIISAFIPIKFYDYRPAEISLSNYDSQFADLKALPFDKESLPSISCMHTIEHIGLGRYGDELDPKGDIKAIDELKRIAKKGADILFVTPIGAPKIQFNGQRVYSREQIVDYFHGCELVEFTLIPDTGPLIINPDPDDINRQSYGCGCFWFKKS
jgi:Caenorhabditis protein of unknown function, DUF268